MNRLLPACIIFCLFLLPFNRVVAVVSSCSATVGISSVEANTTQSYSFSLSNDSDNAISWIQITVPSGNFTIAGGVYAPSGWSGSIDGNVLTITGGNLDPSSSYSFSVQATSADVTAASANWSVSASDDGGGSDPTPCSGSLGTAITGGNENPDADVSAPTISSIVVSDITDTSAKISWTTDEASSTSVDYGSDEGYGSTVTGDGSATSHSVSITGLSANSTYHYDASSADSAGNTANSGDNTFSTAKTGYTGATVTGSVTTVTTIIRSTPAPTPVPDRIPPKIIVSTKIQKLYTKPPQIEGKVSDPSGVVTVEYSLDDGVNFLPVDDFTGAGKSASTFTFIPYQSDDGTYPMVLRATDTKGNTGTASFDPLVIDRLPPAFGTFIVHAGPLLLPQIDAGVVLFPGTQYGIAMSAVGGPTEATLSISPVGLIGKQIEIALRKNPDSGLWTGSISIDTPGEYVMKVSAVDGALNTSTKELGTLHVKQGGRVVGPEGTQITGSEVTVLYLDTATHQFHEWDGLSYGSSNPVHPGDIGSYGMLLPQGTYYVRVSAPGFQPVISTIFTLHSTGRFSQDFTLAQKRAIQIGSWRIPLPDFRQKTVMAEIVSDSDPVSKSQDTRIGATLPFFRFTSASGNTVSSLDLRGKTTLITILNTWSPITPSQLPALDIIARNTGFNSVVIVPQETVQSVGMYAKRGGYAVNIFADPDGALIDTLHIQTSPTHIIVDRKGIILSITRGLMTQNELLDLIAK